MKITQDTSGFSAVELLVTLFVGFLFLIMGYQLYSVAIQNGGDAVELNKASSLAYEQIRKVQLTKGSAFTSGCGAQSIMSNVDNNAAQMTTTMTCPFTVGELSNIRLVVVTVKYNLSQLESKHAMYISRI